MKPCEHCGRVHEGIGGYYDRVECQRRAAAEEYLRAKERGDSPSIVNRLYERMLDAGNTGD